MKTYPEHNLPLKAWAEADRPREKLLHHGKQNLSEAELLAILLASGSKNETAVSLAQRLLQSVNQNLNDLGRCSIAELTEFKGIGQVKALTIIAALELGRRRQLTAIQDRPQIKSSEEAYHILGPMLCDLPHEEFWIILLNRANRVLGKERISTGGFTGTVVDSKIIFQKALVGKACSIILNHNHPSGNLQPSQADIKLTEKLKIAGEALDILVLDHLIIGGKGFYSFADEGLL